MNSERADAGPQTARLPLATPPAGSPVIPLDLSPAATTQFRMGASSFIIAPMAIVAIMASLGSMIYWAAKGQPLSSTEGVVGLVLGTMLLLMIGTSATRTSWGLAMVTVWSAILFAATTALHLLAGSPEEIIDASQRNDASLMLLQLVGPSSWSALPALIFIISVCATVAAWVARSQRRMELQKAESSMFRVSPGLINGDADWFAAPGSPLSPSRARVHLAILVTDLLLGVAAWACLLAMAPTDISGIAVYGSLALALQPVSSLPMLWLVLILSLLTLSTAWSTLGNLVTSFFIMIMPGLLIVPSITSLAGTVATPGAPLATAAALASPVMAACGMVSLSLTLGIHWVRTAPQASD